MNHLTKLSFVKASLTADTALMGASIIPGFVGAGASLGQAGLNFSRGNYWSGLGNAAFAPLAFFGGGAMLAGLKGTVRGAKALAGFKKTAPGLSGVAKNMMVPTMGANSALGKTIVNRPGMATVAGLGAPALANSAQGIADDAKQMNLTRQQWSGAFSNFMDGRRGEAHDPVNAGATGNPNLYT